MVENGAFSNKIDCIKQNYKLLNFKDCQNRITGSRVTANLMSGWILTIGRASPVEGPLSTGPTLSSFLSREHQLQ